MWTVSQRDTLPILRFYHLACEPSSQKGTDMKSSKMLMAAAMAGLLAGSAVVATASAIPNSGEQTIKQTFANSSEARVGLNPGAKVNRLDGSTHACKGQNSCKGQGGCKTSDQGCKGKNSCKGNGGCSTAPATAPAPGIL
jgi:hypothetical protein